ncbi:unnamed protein product, partial [Ectocarpus sp. 4 AP-2014]
WKALLRACARTATQQPPPSRHSQSKPWRSSRCRCRRPQRRGLHRGSGVFRREEAGWRLRTPGTATTMPPPCLLLLQAWHQRHHLPEAQNHARKPSQRHLAVSSPLGRTPELVPPLASTEESHRRHQQTIHHSCHRRRCSRPRTHHRRGA